MLPLFVERELGGDTVAVGIAVGAFAVGAVLLRPYAGRLGDRYGRRLLVISGAFVVAVSALLYLLADNLGILVGARIVGGLGEAAFFVGAGTMIADLAPEARRGEAISYWSVAVYSGIAFGPVLGAAVLDAADYETVWLVSSLLAAAAGFLALAVHETLTDDARAANLARTERPTAAQPERARARPRPLPRPVRARRVHRAAAAVRGGHRARRLQPRSSCSTAA